MRVHRGLFGPHGLHGQTAQVKPAIELVDAGDGRIAALGILEVMDNPTLGIDSNHLGR